MIVLDASAVVEWLLQLAKADAIEARIFFGARSRGIKDAPGHDARVEVI